MGGLIVTRYQRSLEEYWKSIRPSSTDDENSDTETITAGDELQKLQLENIKLKYKASKDKVKRYQSRLNKLESENKLLKSKECKCQNDLKGEKHRNDLLQRQYNALITEVKCKYRLYFLKALSINRRYYINFYLSSNKCQCRLWLH